MKIQFFLTALAILAGAGCGGLPSGTPPPGAIVELRETGALDRKGAENLLITALAGYTARNLPNAPLAIQAEDSDRRLAERILAGAGAISGIHHQNRAAVQFRLYRENNTLTADLYRTGDRTMLWQQKLVLKNEAKERATQ